MNTIITTGKVFADIDALACAVAYNELLGNLGKNSSIVFEGPLNNSVTDTVKKWKYNLYPSLDTKEDYEVVVVDCSNKDVLPGFCDENNVREVWDHRYGYAQQWEKPGTRVVIEEVGACATLIWEEFVRTKLKSKISTVSANLLYTAIISNTLNFRSTVTTDRDREAFEDLKSEISLPDNWIEEYYRESESGLLANIEDSIRNDTKVVDFVDKGIKITIGQLELWNSYEFVTSHRNIVKNVLRSFGSDEWFLTAPSISENKNYIYTESDQVKSLLKKYIGATFDSSDPDLGVTEKLWLRKEILKKLVS